MVKRNKRKKAWVGAAISALGALLNAGASIINTNNQIDAQNRAQEAQRRANIFNANAQNASILQSNLGQLANSEQEERRIFIPTQESAFKLGGRRCKKCGGGRLTKFI